MKGNTIFKDVDWNKLIGKQSINLHEELLMLVDCITDDKIWEDPSTDPDYWRGNF